MRIAHCIHGVGLGGAQQVVRHIVAQRSEGFEYQVLASMSGVFHGQIEAAGASVHVLPRSLPKFDPVWILRLRSAMKRLRIELVHAHLFGDSLHGYLAARSLGLPVVLTLHNIVEARSEIQRRGYRWLLGQPLTAVACAEFVRRSFVEHFGDRASRVVTLQNAVDVPAELGDPQKARRLFEDELGVAPGSTLLAGVGRMVSQKAFENLLGALARVRQEGHNAHLVLFGEGELRSDLEGRAAALGLGNAVTFAGFRDDVRELMAAVDVVVFSSRQEGLPMVLLEAMAASRCVVATRVGGIPEAVETEREALLVDSEDVPALARELGRAVSDPDLRARLGAAAQQRFHRDFTAERMAREYEALYRQLLPEPRTAA